VVEGGTLLRCYTSQRGIEGSNPSSSAPKVPRLQEQREGEEKDWERTRPYYTNAYTNAAKTPFYAATNAAFVILDLYPRHQKLWSPSRRISASLDRKVSLGLLICKILDVTFREFPFHALE
jgi:hypothetical protein